MKFTRDDYNKRIIDTAGKIPDDSTRFSFKGAGCTCTVNPEVLCKTVGGRR